MKIVLLIILMSLSLWANIGHIMAMQGSADIKRADTSLKATIGMPLKEGDEVLTHKQSRMQVMLNDDTVVTIGANSVFSFEEFLFDNSKKSKISMRATRGFFRSVTGKLGKIAPERFKVKTVSATIGIRGTDFSGEIADKKELFQCFSGAISVTFQGVVNKIDAGMMLQILQNKVEIKKIQPVKVHSLKTPKKVKSIQKKEVKKRVVPTVFKKPEIVVTAPVEVRVPTEVTNTILHVVDERYSFEPEVKTPLEVTPSFEDRERVY